MAIKIKFNDYALQTNETLTQKIQFVYSPLNELFRSLHILLNPRHHGMHISWALDVQQRLPHHFFDDLQYFSLFYELGVPPILFNNFERFSSNLDEEIEQLKSYLLETNAQNILFSLKKVITNRDNQFIPTLAKNLEWQGFSPTSSNDLLTDLNNNPQRVYTHLLNFINDYRELVFDSMWQSKHLEQFLLTEIKQQSLYLAQYGFVKLINHLEIDRIYWQQENLIIIKPFEETINLSNQDTILLIPSYFIWPHLFVDEFQHGITLNYDALNRQQDTIDAQYLTHVFNALSDIVRLKIMKYLSEQPSTTQALGQVLMMSESTVSHHLKLLKAAGLVITQKKGKFVLYRPSTIVNDLIPDFYQLLKNN